MIMGSSNRSQPVPSFLARRPLLRTIRIPAPAPRTAERRDAPERQRQDESRQTR